MPPPDAERGPGQGPVRSLQLFTQDTTDTSLPPAMPRCAGCMNVTLRVGADGRPWHSTCEPRDARLTDPATSRAAAKTARKGPGSPLARKILGLLRTNPEGLTDDELAQLLPDHPVGSIAKRRLDLVRAGLVFTTVALPLTRRTRWGKEATVWLAEPNGET